MRIPVLPPERDAISRSGASPSTHHSTYPAAVYPDSTQGPFSFRLSAEQPASRPPYPSNAGPLGASVRRGVRPDPFTPRSVRRSPKSRSSSQSRHRTGSSGHTPPAILAWLYTLPLAPPRGDPLTRSTPFASSRPFRSRTSS